ncbi:hypothetical protein SAMN05216389_106103 [Oceanobacillus limi]|uniref:Uncharacterized protein n=1 Tax=Oceanobacillus limi TaxID=930131 RepID=A0A1I0C9J4_9BACI|nr:hypothetical protein SAMN05216389_106103 [Oceanobacillus limi]
MVTCYRRSTAGFRRLFRLINVRSRVIDVYSGLSTFRRELSTFIPAYQRSDANYRPLFRFFNVRTRVIDVWTRVINLHSCYQRLGALIDVHSDLSTFGLLLSTFTPSYLRSSPTYQPLFRFINVLPQLINLYSDLSTFDLNFSTFIPIYQRSTSTFQPLSELSTFFPNLSTFTPSYQRSTSTYQRSAPTFQPSPPTFQLSLHIFLFPFNFCMSLSFSDILRRTRYKDRGTFV